MLTVRYRKNKKSRVLGNILQIKILTTLKKN
jgi:hypothetical protein